MLARTNRRYCRTARSLPNAVIPKHDRCWRRFRSVGEKNSPVAWIAFAPGRASAGFSKCQADGFSGLATIALGFS
jgi:hypothetical protein